jgi:cbb3-type cytochrome oxidase maturation protein
MSVIILLVIIGVVVAGLFLLGFIWAVKSGQYDDMYSPSVRILFDNNKESTEEPTKKDSSTIAKKK